MTAREIDFTRNVPDQVAEWLEEAALTLAALPGGGHRLGAKTAQWPEMVRDLEELGWDRESDERMPAPAADAVTRMDIALGWLSTFGPAEQRLRKVVNMRLVVHPISGQHRWTWRKIAEKFSIDHKTAKQWHRVAVEHIGKKISEPEFFSPQTPHFALFPKV
ncbi:hypothetical protein AA103196_2285 [Ameyamaea chiangmaiensis NBRC 103196]|uniref:DUF6362 domain-containing protein n=1 Tax=Ameyamaea chiangmaiensis TaxID=442969 RepID=A0A850PAS1_9PROT|nr:DUF6362 family protein [Ameyamaea chiangmaiensis]MBS4075456.1 hypothetical protein [Ameyamaea chiangmaiensis]NVN39012.1 hypothetical protein [Ameyamaea chiangmaiensis]GBQ69696.1 hypothetical protein AA103196_2285 [Ameyamaea chiangmaiensis NBRC 103196]